MPVSQSLLYGRYERRPVYKMVCEVPLYSKYVYTYEIDQNQGTTVLPIYSSTSYNVDNIVRNSTVIPRTMLYSNTSYNVASYTVLHTALKSSQRCTKLHCTTLTRYHCITYWYPENRVTVYYLYRCPETRCIFRRPGVAGRKSCRWTCCRECGPPVRRQYHTKHSYFRFTPNLALFELGKIKIGTLKGCMRKIEI